MPLTCIVVGCGSRGDRDRVKFFSVPTVLNHRFLTHKNELSERRRALWLSAIRREDLTEKTTKYQRVCSKHFITGKPAALEDENHPDWVPSQNMGHTSLSIKKRPRDVERKQRLDKRKKLQVYGGTGSPFGARCSNQLHICRISNDSNPMIEVNTSGQLPIPQYGQALIFHNDYLYTIGGTTGLTYTCDIHRLSLKTLRWEIVYVSKGQGDYEPKGRYRHEVCFDGKKIYVLGGGTATDAYDFLDIPTFDLERKQWLKQRTLKAGSSGVPQPRRCHGAVQVEQSTGIQVFITGGHDGENIFNDLWRLDLATFQWTYFSLCELPSPTYFHAASVTPEGRLYVYGGICKIYADVRRSNAVYSTWLCVPKLSEMCWEAVLHYSPHIVECKSSNLINIGLPRHFVQRLGNNRDVCEY